MRVLFNISMVFNSVFILTAAIIIMQLIRSPLLSVAAQGVSKRLEVS